MPKLHVVLAASLSAASVAFSGPAAANDPTGEWLVKDKVATMRIENCGGAGGASMWGAVEWEKEPGGTDSNNPDPKKRTRPTLGMPIILGMKPTQPNKWEGEIYNSQDGRTYTANISLAKPDVLRVTGCLLIFCGGEDWTRVTAQAPRPGASKAGAPKPGAPKPKTAKEFCAGIPEAAPPPGAPAPPQKQAPKR